MADYLPIAFYLISLCFTAWTAKRLRMPALSPYWVFLAFQTLYNVTPWVLERAEIAPALFTLLSERGLIQTQLTCAAFANISFALVYLFRWKRVRFHSPSSTQAWGPRRRFLYAAFPLFVITCVLSHFYGWHQYTAAGYESSGTEALGGLFTVAAYAKFIFVSVYLYYLYRFGLDKGAWILMAEHVVVLGLDGARATFLPIVLLTLFLFADQQTNPKILRKVYALAFLGLVLSVGVRSLIIVGDSLALKLVTPIAVEGGMGDYPALQSIAGMERSPAPTYTYGASYVVDPLVWLLPQAVGRADLLFFDRWTTSINPALADTFAPMGGFYYLAEAFAAFSYAGPVLVTTLFAWCLVWFELHKNTHVIAFLSWMPTIGLMFVKTQFGNVVKLFLIQLLCIYFIKGLREFKLFLLPGWDHKQHQRSV